MKVLMVFYYHMEIVEIGIEAEAAAKYALDQ